MSNALATRRSVLPLLTALVLANGSIAQAQSNPPVPTILHDTLAQLDATLFESFMACNVDRFKTFFTDDLEFYHDKVASTPSLARRIEILEEGCRRQVPGGR